VDVIYLNEYIKKVSLIKPYDDDKGEIDVDLLFDLQETHLPILIEINRILISSINKCVRLLESGLDEEIDEELLDALGEAADLAQQADPFLDADLTVN
jgi:hypothetical protein